MRNKKLAGLVLVGTLTGAGLTPAHAQDEAVAYASNYWFDSWADHCDGGDLAFSNAFASAFKTHFDLWSWGQNTAYYGMDVSRWDWTDPSKNASGDDNLDPAGVDHADVALFSGHGTSYINTSTGTYYSSIVPQNDSGTGACAIRTDNHMLLGTYLGSGTQAGGDLEISVMAACRTAQKNVWNNTGYFDLVESYSTFSTWLGFHGISYDSLTDLGRLGTFLATSYSNEVGDNWLDAMYRTVKVDGVSYDQCPVAVLFGSSTGDTDFQFDFGGFGDRKDTGTKSLSVYYYFSGCDPQAGFAL